MCVLQTQAGLLDDIKEVMDSQYTVWFPNSQNQTGSQQTWAQDAQLTQRYQRDISQDLLCRIFSPMPANILHCSEADALDVTERADISSEQLTAGLRPVPAIFMLFNTGLLVFVFGMLGYSLIVFSLSSYDQTQSLSARLSPFYMARTFIGIGALLPMKGGYSSLQYFVMYVVMQSVHLANYTWNMMIVPSLPEVGSEAPPQTQGAANTLDMKKLMMKIAQRDTDTTVTYPTNMCTSMESRISNELNTVTSMDVMAMSLCAAMHEKVVHKDKGEGDYGAMLSTVSKNCRPSLSGYTAAVCFGDKEPSATAEKAQVCGKIHFKTQSALRYIGPTLLSADKIAKKYMGKTYIDDAGSSVSDKGRKVFKGCFVNPELMGMGKCDGLCLLKTDILALTSQYAQALSIAAMQATANSSSGLKQYATGTKRWYAQQQGWASAGRYFWDIVTPRAQKDVEQQACVCTNGMVDAQAMQEASASHLVYCGAYCPMGVLATESADNTRINSPYCKQQDRLGFGLLPPSSEANTLQQAKIAQNNLFESMLPAVDVAKSQRVQESGASAVVWSQIRGLKSQDSTRAEPDEFRLQPTMQSKSACVVAKQLLTASELQPDGCTTRSGEDWTGAAGKINDSKGPEHSDSALRNMMTSVFMALERLTGFTVFRKPVMDSSSGGNNYAALAQQSCLYNSPCACIIKSFKCESSELDMEVLEKPLSKCPVNYEKKLGGWSSWSRNTVGKPLNFLSTMALSGCLQMTGNSSAGPLGEWKTSQAGLYGQILVRENLEYVKKQGVAYALDPALNMMQMGGSMMTGSLFYYFVTLRDIGNSLTKSAALFSILGFSIRTILNFVNGSFNGRHDVFWGNFSERIDQILGVLFAAQKVALEIFLPFGSAVATLMFTQGFVLGVYLPFLAFLFYTLGVLGWLISVIEAMLAAPLIALGITHPRGHDILGQSEQSLMMMVNTFTKPILLVLGMVFAIKSSHILLDMLNHSFSYAMLEYADLLFGKDTGRLLVPEYTNQIISIASFLGVFLVYTYMAYMALEVSYSLIVRLPDRLMKWAGAMGDNGMDIKGYVSKVQQGSSQTSQAISQTASSARSASVERVKPQQKSGGPEQKDLKESGQGGGGSGAESNEGGRGSK